MTLFNYQFGLHQIFGAEKHELKRNYKATKTTTLGVDPQNLK